MIIRSKRESSFTIVRNSIIDDPNLDWKELGLLVYLLTKPDNWEVSPSHLAKQKKTGRDGIYTLLKKLREAGYVQVNKRPNGEVDWIVFDYPNTENPYRENTDKGYPNTENPDRENTDKGYPNTENPDRENPYLDFPTQVNTEYKINTEEEVNNAREKSAKIPPITEQLQNLPSGLSIEAAEEFIRHRTKLKKPLTDYAFLLTVREAANATKFGLTPDDVINETISNGWQKVSCQWIYNQQCRNAGNHHESARTNNKRDPFTAAMSRIPDEPTPIDLPTTGDGGRVYEGDYSVST